MRELVWKTSSCSHDLILQRGQAGLFGISAGLFGVSVTYGSVDSSWNSSSSRDLIQQRSQSRSVWRISKSLLCFSYIWECWFMFKLIEFAWSYTTAQPIRVSFAYQQVSFCVSVIYEGVFSRLISSSSRDLILQRRHAGLFCISAGLFCVSVIYEGVFPRLISSSSRDLIQQRRHAGLFIASMGLFCVVWIYECILLKVRLIRLYELDFARPYPTAWPPRCVCKRDRAKVRVWESKNYSLSLTHTLSGPRSRSRSLLRAHSLSCSLPLSLPPSH